MWVFGYGSLVWYTNFPVKRRVWGRVSGFVRRFWQKSPDHRGTPTRPGRTVTLVPQKDGVVYGIAYEINEDDIEQSIAYLDHREKAGYEMTKVRFTVEMPPANEHSTSADLVNDTEFDVFTYISPQSDHEHAAVGESITEIARTVVSCRGPSGSNIEYVLRLAQSLRAINPSAVDDHLRQVELAVVELCHEQNIADKCLDELGYLRQGQIAG